MSENQEVGTGLHAYLLALPGNVGPGKWQAAEYFAEAIVALKERHPTSTFDFIPIAYSSSGGLEALLAIKK